MYASNKTKRLLCLLLALLIAAAAGCAPEEAPGPRLPVSGENSMTAAVVYDSSCADGTWEDTLGYLEQSLVLGVSAAGIDVRREFDLSGCDILYVDSSAAASENAPAVKEAVTAQVSAGATAILENELHGLFDAEFIGASAFEKLDGFPAETEAADAGSEFEYMQGIITDFALLCRSFPDFESSLASRDFGCAIVCGTARPIISCGDRALYSINSYGEGSVFFTNPLLPNAFSVSGFDMLARSGDQAAFSPTTASCSRLLVNAFAEYVFMERFGYSMSRVFGSYGGTNMAWELHCGEMSSFENGSARIFGELCREYLQIPSYSLIRSAYEKSLRQESVTYLLNLTPDGHRYEMDFSENAYSSGTHIDAGGQWLGLSRTEDSGSYLAESPEPDHRAAPAVGDFDADGLVDLICGSESGLLWFFRGEGFEDRLQVAEGRLLCDPWGEPLSVPGHSCPIIRDLNSDGVEDILCGGADGGLYVFYGRGGMIFSSAQRVNGIDAETQVMPTMGDIDGDGRSELVIGTGDGRILKAESLRGSFTDISHSVADMDRLGSWLCPTVYDYNGDGLADLVIGTFPGYIALRLNKGDHFASGGYISCSEKNHMGNYNLKFGNYCVPRFRDLDGNGTDDLICGSLEYGMAVPIDSEYFPFAEELREQTDYMRENHFYCGFHFYTNSGASPAREDFELQAQAASRSFYGLSNELQGANRHEWHTAEGSANQSFLSLWRNGILWSSGFTGPYGADAEPYSDAHNAVALPFFLELEGERSILIQSSSTVLHGSEEAADISARYDMPLCLYCSGDFGPEDTAAAESLIREAEEFRAKHGYNFVSEDQMMPASAAACNLVASAYVAEDGQLRITPGAQSRDFPLYSEEYQSACGIRLRFSDEFDRDMISSSASVQKWKDGALYLSLDRPVSISFDGSTAPSPIIAVNIPADISLEESGASFAFLDDGMMQVTVTGSASTDCAGWSVESSGGKTTFTKFGAAETLTIKF